MRVTVKDSTCSSNSNTDSNINRKNNSNMTIVVAVSVTVTVIVIETVNLTATPHVGGFCVGPYKSNGMGMVATYVFLMVSEDDIQ